MTICGVICELNPFHNGHSYLFEQARKITNADYVIAVMSGDFVQRGIPAICDKYSRARMALLGGADLVVELPMIFATASADYFAQGSVSVLEGCGCVDYICFGSENGDINALYSVARRQLLDDEAVNDGMKNGHSYAKTRTIAENIAIDSNDMLATCYLKSLERLNSTIKPVVVKRKGGAYLDVNTSSGSATAIRKQIYGGKSTEGMMPSYASRCMYDVQYKYFPIQLNDFSIQLYSVIDSIIKREKRGLESLTEYMDVSANISGRIRSNIADYTSYKDFVEKIHSKEYTKSRIMRALLHIMLDVRKDMYSKNISECNSSYIRVLGFRRKSTGLLGIIKENAIIPVISKAKDAGGILDDDAMSVFEADIDAANMYEQACAFKFSFNPVHDYSKEIVIV